MSRQQGIGFLGNSFANLAVGAAALAYAVFVPAVVIRQYGTDLYGDWYLAFQVAAYVLLLDLGSQHIVTSDAATPSRRPDAARLATAAMVVQAGLGLAVIAVAMAWARLAGQATVAQLIAILGVGAAASLSATTVRAWFGGLERAHVPAVWLVGARAAALVGLGLAVAAESGLTTLTVAVVAPQVVVHATLLFWCRRPPSPWARPDRASFVRLVRATSPLAVWTVCGILIGGVDIFVVRAVDPSEVGRYAIALPILAVPVGVATAAMSAWIPLVARAHAEGDEGGRVRTLTGTTVALAVLSMGAVPFVAYADEIVRVWAGAGRGGSAATYLRLLYVATMMRFVFLPWALLVIVRGEQRTITPAPLAEAIVNLVASVAFGLWLGALGVAIGTLVGAIVAAVIYVFWAVPRTERSGVTSASLLRAVGGAWPPFVAAAALSLVTLTGAVGTWRAIGTLACLGVGTWWAVGYWRAMTASVSVGPY